MKAGILAVMGDAEDDRDLLIGRISREETRLAEIELARIESEKRSSALRSQLTTLGSEVARQGISHPSRSSAEKVELFHTLFVGRTDVESKRRSSSVDPINPRTGGGHPCSRTSSAPRPATSPARAANAYER